MKQGQILNRIVMLVLFGAILVYLGVNVVGSLTDPLITTLSYTYTVDDAVETTGLLVREETVLPAQTLYADILPAEGEKVAKGESVAYLYQSADALERSSQIQALALQLEQLEYTLDAAGDGGDSAQLNREILDSMVELKASVARRELNGLSGDTLDLKSLIYKREYAYGDGDLEATQQAASDLRSQISSLQSAAAASTQVVTASVSGTFSGVVDGYETLLTPESLESLTPSALEELERREVSGDEGAVGKLITDSTWYFVCNVDEADARRLVEGESITVRFSRDWSGEVSMTIERLSEPEEGQVLVVLSSDRYLSETTLLRGQSVELIFDSVTGIRVPKEAVRVEERTGTDEETDEEYTYQQTVVYAVVGAQAEAKDVTILAEGEDFFLVEAVEPDNPDNTTQAKKALRSGDEIIVRAENLYDGKVLRTG